MGLRNRRHVAALAAALFAALGAGEAVAGTVTVTLSPTTGVERLIFTADANETNDVHVDVTFACTDADPPECSMWADVVDSAAELVAVAPCEQQTPNSARCTLSDARTTWLDLTLGDGADSADIAGACYVGEWENDLCAAVVDGGDGNDALTGTHELGGWQPQPNETLRGGSGNDVLYGGSKLDGGAGADEIRGIAGEPEDESLVVYEGRVAPVSVTLNGLADDGEADEYDLVVDVNGAIGGAGDDVFIDDTDRIADDYFRGGGGRDFAHVRGGWDWAEGGPGADEIWGSSGRDQLFGDGGADIVRGGDGVDVVRGGPGNDRLWGGRHADYVAGQAGSDAITPGPGADVAAGGDGNDTFNARDGSADRVRGGSGWDRARIDWGRDSVASVEAFF